MPLHHCGYLEYKKESRALIAINARLLIYKHLFLLAITAGQELSGKLNRPW
jgi:hypothetical protein